MAKQYGNEYAAILLAAGQSQRFGSPKLLQPLADGTPLGVVAAITLQAVFEQVIVVVSDALPMLDTHYRALGVSIVVNKKAQQGMGTSLASGIAHSRNCQGWLVALADMPTVQVATVRSVAAALAAGAPIVLPTYQGQRGHPVGFAGIFAKELLQLQGDVGGKSIVHAYAQQVQTVPVNDAGILCDVDTWTDWQALLA